jgi:transcriptional regulator with XRE-family HTH domain
MSRLIHESCQSSALAVDFDRLFPERIAVLRAFFDLTASDLDTRANYGVGTTGRLERGHQRVYASHLIRICQCTGVSLDYFYNPLPTPPLPGSLETHEKFRLLNAYRAIDDQAIKRNVFELIESLAGEQGEDGHS